MAVKGKRVEQRGEKMETALARESCTEALFEVEVDSELGDSEEHRASAEIEW